MPTTASEPGSLEELTAFYGEPVANTRRHGPVWIVDGELVGADQLLGPEEYGCGC